MMANRARFERLFRTHYSAISAFCLRRLDAADADDVVAEVFAATWNRLDDVDETQARAWLYAVARNKVAHRWRANGRRADATGRLVTESRAGNLSGSVVDPAELVADVDLISTAARSLSPADLDLLQLVSWEGLGPDELAVVLDCTAGAATVRVHRMRKRLQEGLDALQSPAGGGNGTVHEPDHSARSEKR